MNYFKCGDRVKLNPSGGVGRWFPIDTAGVVVGYATLQSGVPCVVVSMDTPARCVRFARGDEWAPRVLTDRLVVPMVEVEPL